MQLVTGDKVLDIATLTDGQFLRRSGATVVSAVGTRILYATGQATTGTGAGEQTILTYTVPAGTLGTNKIIRIRYAIRRTTGSGSVIVTTKFNGTRLDAETARTTANWKVDGVIAAAGSASVQRSEVTTQSYTTGTVTNLNNVVGYAFDSTTALNITLNFTLTTSTDGMTLDYCYIELMESP